MFHIRVSWHEVPVSVCLSVQRAAVAHQRVSSVSRPLGLLSSLIECERSLLIQNIVINVKMLLNLWTFEIIAVFDKQWNHGLLWDVE